MKLQANFNGAWRDVIEFEGADLPLVRFAAGMLAAHAKAGKLAIVDGEAKRHYHSIERGHPVWRTAAGCKLPERVS
jgi:hypothetical protein